MANTISPYFLHSAACAATKAEGRALRKALNLKCVYAAEEMKDQPEDTMDTKRLINTSQFSFLDMKCHDLNINAVALLNSGKEKYNPLTDMPYEKALKIFDYLNQIQTGMKKLQKILALPAVLIRIAGNLPKRLHFAGGERSVS